MPTEPTRADVTGVRQATRTGPVGRLVRLLLAAVLGWLAYDLWVDRAFILAEAEPGILVLTALAVYGLHHIAGLVGWGRQVLAVLAVTATASAAVALVLAGAIWAAPLTWLVWGVDLGVLVVVVLALLMAVVIGTPGCEIGVFRELLRRLRGEADGGEALFCVAGLHQIDAWEARRSWRRRR